MSLSFLDRSCVQKSALQTTVALALLSAASGAGAAQYYWQPMAELSAESNTNVELDPAVGTDRKEGYIAELGTVLGIATPRSETTVIPRLQYQNYPDLDEANRLQGDVGFTSAFRTQRSQFNVFGNYEYRDQLNGELPDARFDPINPNVPLSPETGRNRAGTTRQMLTLSPTYSFKATERTSLGAGMIYQGIDFSPNDGFAFIDFDYYNADVSITQQLSPRLDVSFSPYAGKYKARDLDSEVDSVGAAIETGMNWSQTLKGGLRLSYERAKIDQTEPVPNNESINAWGAAFNLTKRGEISQLQLSVGRAVTPSGGGSMYYTDQFQIQYDRDLSERLELQSAARFIRDESLSGAVAAADRDYLQADIGLQWMLTRTFYVRAGYQYLSQEFEADNGDAKNHRVSLAFGYRGLEPQRQY